jgi:predicted MFS family arabinose efflux permease
MIAGRAAAALFIAFAFAYFFSALLRAVTATLAPVFSSELGLGRADLGLLAGAYFVGFALPQLPLGSALDRYGPKRVLLAMLAAAVVGCAAFAQAPDFASLLAARALIGVGVSACLMAPLTAYRRHFAPELQLRANAWMLMTGSLGMLSSTQPVQLLLPTLGWRGLFWVIAVCLLLACVLVAIAVPRDTAESPPRPDKAGYLVIFRHPTFVRLMPLGLVNNGGLIAVQALWAGPWMTDVAGRSPAEAASGLFFINLSMLLAFLTWGTVMPRLVARGWTAQRLIAFGMPLSIALLALAVFLGPAAGAVLWAAWCVASTFVSLAQPTVGQAFEARLAGRALSAFNLVIFLGVFVVQWGIGLAIDAFIARGFAEVDAYRAAFAGFGACCAMAYLWFLRHPDAPAKRR